MVAVAVVVHSLVGGMGWAVAFALGAIVSPPDSVAATQIAGKLGLPRRLVTILGGEGLMNDATALTAYQLAIAAVGTAFTLADVFGTFVFAVAVGVGIGVAVGWFGCRMLRFTETPVIENTMLLILVFLLTGVSFLLVGLELRPILDTLTNRESGALVIEALAVVATVIVVRMVWMFGAVALPGGKRLFSAYQGVAASWRETTVVGWAGMRGAVSLAAALALPQTFPHRDLLVFLTFAVIVATLLGQGLTLPPLIRRLGLVTRDEQDAVLVAEARRRLTVIALSEIDGFSRDERFPPEVVQRVRAGYDSQLARIDFRLEMIRSNGTGEDPTGSSDGYVEDGGPQSDPAALLRAEREIRRLVIGAERVELDHLLNRRKVSKRVADGVRVALDVDETTMRP